MHKWISGFFLPAYQFLRRPNSHFSPFNFPLCCNFFLTSFKPHPFGLGVQKPLAALYVLQVLRPREQAHLFFGFCTIFQNPGSQVQAPPLLGNTGRASKTRDSRGSFGFFFWEMGPTCVTLLISFNNTIKWGLAYSGLLPLMAKVRFYLDPALVAGPLFYWWDYKLSDTFDRATKTSVHPCFSLGGRLC